MTDRAAAEAWVRRYEQAWESNDREDIGALFTDNAVYRPTPMSAGWVGREAIVAGWLDRKDDPGTWEFSFEVLAVEGDLAVVKGTTRYEAPYPTFENLWLVRLNDSGRAAAFTEFWMETKHPAVPEGADPPTIDGLRAAFLELVDGFRKQAPDAQMLRVDEDLILWYPQLPEANRESMARAAARMAGLPKAEFDVDVRDIQVAGDLGTVLVRWTRTGPNRDGETVTSYEQDLEVWRLGAGGRWRLIRGVSFPEPQEPHPAPDR